MLVVPSIVLAAAYSMLSPANADHDYRRAFESTLTRLDKDHKGMIDRQEFADQTFLVLSSSGAGNGALEGAIHGPPNYFASSPELRGDFAAQDENGDGRITLTEYIAYRHILAHRQFGTLDANSDGRISRAEFKQQLGVPAGDPGRRVFVSQDSKSRRWLLEQELDR